MIFFFIKLTDAATPPAIKAFLLCLFANSYRVYNFLPTQTGIPDNNNLKKKKQNSMLK